MQLHHSNLNTYCFAIQVECFIPKLHEQLKACFRFLSGNHDVMEVDRFAFDKSFAQATAFLLQFIHAIDEFLECMVETWAIRRGWSAMLR